MSFARASSTLPPLSADEVAHAGRLRAALAARIHEAGGAIPFAEFMALALYAPGLGYYSAGTRKFGRDGDFTTAPELSPLFGRCVARQCAAVLAATGGEVLELGAGSGALAATVLETLDEAGALPAAYRILEVSADLRERQRERLDRLPRSLAARVSWLDRLPDTPLNGVILANEVLDALPCERFVWRKGRVRSLGVGLDAAGALVDAELDATPALAAAVATIAQSHQATHDAPLPNDFRGEVCLGLAPWIASTSTGLARGAWFAFDYGLPRSALYRADRASGTVRAHFRHRAHDDVLRHPGLQDVTAWVDFTAVAEAAADAGLAVAGFTTQAAFLLALGIEHDVASEADPVRHAQRAAEARELLLPEAMGETFKAIALTRGLEAPLTGFALRDLRRQL
jgi:SAM-dependent MidA family methyltransferase